MTDPIAPSGSLGQVSLAAPSAGSLSAKSAAGLPGTGFQAAAQAALQATATGGALPAGRKGPLSPADPMSPASALKAKDPLHPDPLDPKSEAAPSAQTLEEAAKSFQEYLKNLPSDLQFRPDSKSGLVIFKVVNPLTQEVIRTYPPEEVVEMARWIRENSMKSGSGIFLDQQL